MSLSRRDLVIGQLGQALARGTAGGNGGQALLDVAVLFEVQ